MNRLPDLRNRLRLLALALAMGDGRNAVELAVRVSTSRGSTSRRSGSKSWRILEHHDGVFASDWADGRAVPVVRLLAQKPASPAAGN